MENLFGPMEENILEIISMTKNMDKVHSNGLMEENIKDNGKMENNMEEEFI